MGSFFAVDCPLGVELVVSFAFAWGLWLSLDIGRARFFAVVCVLLSWMHLTFSGSARLTGLSLSFWYGSLGCFAQFDGRLKVYVVFGWLVGLARTASF